MRAGAAVKATGVVLALAASLVAATSAQAAPTRLDMGVYDPSANQNGGGVDYSTLPADVAMQSVDRTGSRFVRIPVRWDRIACSSTNTPCRQADRPAQPWAPGGYAWKRSGWYDLDDEVNQARAHGLVPVLTVFGAPAYAECDGTGRRTGGDLWCGGVNLGPDEGNLKPKPADFAAFLKALSAKYPKVRYFQVWNEPNHALFLRPAHRPKTIDRYRKLVNAASNALPRKFIIAGGTSPNAWPRRFLEQLVSRRVAFDAYSVHPYTPGGPWTRAEASAPSIWMGNLGRVRSIVRAAERSGRIKSPKRVQLWVTEMGWDSAPPDCVKGMREGRVVRAVPSDLLTRWTAESAYSLWRQGFQVLIWSQLKDFPPEDNPHQGGLYGEAPKNRVGRAKAAAKAFAFPFVAYKRDGGAYVWGRRPTSRSGRVVVDRRVRGKWDRVATLRTAGRGLFQRRLHFGLTKVTALRARIPNGGRASPAFALSVPRVPAGIQPFGCSTIAEWVR